MKVTLGLKSLRGRPIAAADGDIGSLVDVYFDDAAWRVRYFVLDTGNPMPKRQVLVAPSLVTGCDRARIHVRLSKEQVAKCPELDDDKPVYLQHDMASISYRGDRHLRSCDVVSGCAVAAADGLAGHVKDLLADPGTWSIAALVVDTGLWFPGKRVLLAPRDVTSIDWLERRLRTRLSRAQVRAASLGSTDKERRAEDRAVQRVP